MKIEDSHNLKFTSEQQKAVVNIRITSNFIGGKQHQLMSQFGLSMAQFNVLGILRGAKTPLSVHVVKERMIEKSPNTTRLMDKLIEKELIIRTRCESDKRIVFVEISEKGLELLLQIDEKLEEVNFISKGLTNKEAEQLNELLDKVREKW
jgi:DNA-binding MarR family transcriptional regulator